MCFRYAPPRCNSVRLPSLAYCSLDKGVAYKRGGACSAWCGLFSSNFLKHPVSQSLKAMRHAECVILCEGIPDIIHQLRIQLPGWGGASMVCSILGEYPENVRTHPRTSGKRPRTSEKTSANIRKMFGDIHGHPVNVRGHPENICRRPGNIRGHPENVRTYEKCPRKSADIQKMSADVRKTSDDMRKMSAGIRKTSGDIRKACRKRPRTSGLPGMPKQEGIHRNSTDSPARFPSNNICSHKSRCPTGPDAALHPCRAIWGITLGYLCAHIPSSGPPPIAPPIVGEAAHARPPSVPPGSHFVFPLLQHRPH